MPRSSFRLLAAAAVVAAVACTSPQQRGPEREPADRPDNASPDRASEILRARLSAVKPPAVLAGEAGADLWNRLRRLYAARGHRPFWLEGGRARPEVAAVRDAIRRAEEDGLHSADYDPAAAETVLAARPGGFFRRATVPLATLMDADVRLSSSFLMLVSHLDGGRLAGAGQRWFAAAAADDPLRVLEQGLESGTLAERLEEAWPQHPQYAALKQALARYRRIADEGGWPQLPEDLRLKRGQSHPEVARLRARLAAGGDLALPPKATSPRASSPAARAGATPAPAPVFDEEMREALKRYERRHGLAADGRLDGTVVQALNVPVEARIRQIELNLERWRWLPRTLGDRYVLVNIPTFHLLAVDDGRTELEMRVVAGKMESPTPVFSDEMVTVVFSPYWNVPAGIARDETIPAVMRDPGYVYRNNLEVVLGSRVVDPWSVDWSRPGRVKFRQRPGARNALGGVKFIFPNRHNVYLHDTPADALFARVERDYSHGCVRVEKPFELAQWALQDQESWTPERIRAAMRSGRERHVALEEKIGVFIVYQTVWVREDGTVEFREDVYGHDAKQERLLPAGPAPDVRVARQEAPPAVLTAAAGTPRLADAN